MCILENGIKFIRKILNTLRKKAHIFDISTLNFKLQGSIEYIIYLFLISLN